MRRHEPPLTTPARASTSLVERREREQASSALDRYLAETERPPCPDGCENGYHPGLRCDEI